MNGGRPADRGRPHLGEPDVAHVARLHHVRNRADRIFNGHCGVEARRTIDVDVFQSQALQRVRQGGLYSGRTRIISGPIAGWIPLRAELHAQLEAIARYALQCLTDEELVVAHAVEITCVEQRDAGIEGRFDGGDGFAPIGRTIHARHAHAAQAEGGNLGAGLAERAQFHGLSNAQGDYARCVPVSKWIYAAWQRPDAEAVRPHRGSPASASEAPIQPLGRGRHGACPAAATSICSLEPFHVLNDRDARDRQLLRERTGRSRMTCQALEDHDPNGGGQTVRRSRAPRGTRAHARVILP